MVGVSVQPSSAPSIAYTAEQNVTGALSTEFHLATLLPLSSYDVAVRPFRTLHDSLVSTHGLA